MNTGKLSEEAIWLLRQLDDPAWAETPQSVAALDEHADQARSRGSHLNVEGLVILGATDPRRGVALWNSLACAIGEGDREAYVFAAALTNNSNSNKTVDAALDFLEEGIRRISARTT